MFKGKKKLNICKNAFFVKKTLEFVKNKQHFLTKGLKENPKHRKVAHQF